MTLQAVNVGDRPNPPGHSILFCNGIENDLGDATESARLISDACRGRVVTLLHNETKLSQFAGLTTRRLPNGNTGLAFDYREPSRQRQVAEKMAQFIQGKIQDYRHSHIPEESIKIFLFAHSHGAVLTDLALKNLAEEDKRRVVVLSYGGAKLLEKSIAGAVHNYFNQNDRIASLGQIHTRKGSQDFLSVFADREIWECNDEEEALHYIRCKSVQDTYQFVFQRGNSERYAKIVLEKDPKKRLVNTLKDPYCQQRIAHYEGLKHKYNVKILQGPRQEQVEGLLYSLMSHFSHAYASHSFSSYTVQVQQDSAMIVGA